MRRLKLLLQRLLIALVGAIAVWLIAFVFFDFADKRLPFAVALAVTYAVAAYLILPWSIRLGLKLLRRGRVPSYTTTGDGLPGDPVNLALVGTRAQLAQAFTTAGWTGADALGLASSWRMTKAFVLNRPYPTAPFSSLYLFGRRQDIGFQEPIGASPRKRHHVRFWSLPLDKVEDSWGTAAFWTNEDRPDDSRPVLWIGAATRDTGLSLTRLSFQITHATDADTNAERDFVVGELARVGVITGIRSHAAGERVETGKVNRYVTDGEVTVAELGAPAAPHAAPSGAGTPAGPA